MAWRCNDEAARWLLQSAWRCDGQRQRLGRSPWTSRAGAPRRVRASRRPVSGAERFDHLSFGVSAAEAGAMDPQQRLLLELGYASLHGASRRRAVLMGATTACSWGSSVGLGLAQPPSGSHAVTGGVYPSLQVACHLCWGCRAHARASTACPRR